jgi:hypothetical protein
MTAETQKLMKTGKRVTRQKGVMSCPRAGCGKSAEKAKPDFECKYNESAPRVDYIRGHLMDLNPGGSRNQ